MSGVDAGKTENKTYAVTLHQDGVVLLRDAIVSAATSMRDLLHRAQACPQYCSSQPLCGQVNWPGERSALFNFNIKPPLTH